MTLFNYRNFASGMIFCTLILCSSCAKKTTSLQLQFTPKWGSDNFKLNTTYATPNAYVNFSTLELYISHIRLIRADNSEVEVDSAELIKYADNAITMNLIPAIGTYKGVKFSIGLDSAQNRVAPNPNAAPVFIDNSLWWPQGGFDHLFIAVDGHSGTTSDLGSFFGYHIGRDSTYRTTTVTKTFSVSDGQTTTLILTPDMRQLFTGPNAINVISQPETQSGTAAEMPLAYTFANDFSQIFSIQ